MAMVSLVSGDLTATVAQHEREAVFVRMLKTEPDIFAEILAQKFLRLRAADVHGVQGCAELAERRVDEPVEHLVLALEIDVERGLRNADAGGDLAGRDVLDAMFEEQRSRRAKNLFGALVAIAARLPRLGNDGVGPRRSVLDRGLNHAPSHGVANRRLQAHNSDN